MALRRSFCFFQWVPSGRLPPLVDRRTRPSFTSSSWRKYSFPWSFRTMNAWILFSVGLFVTGSHFVMTLNFLPLMRLMVRFFPSLPSSAVWSRFRPPKYLPCLSSRSPLFSPPPYVLYALSAVSA